MAFKVQRLTLLAIAAGVVYFTLIAAHCFLNGMYNLATLGLISSFIAFTFIYFYLSQRQIMQQKELHDLISDKNKFESRYIECNQTFNAMFDNVSDGIALLNLQLDFFKTNTHFCDIFGYTAEKILNWNLDELINLEPMSPHTLGINQLLAGKAENYLFKKKITKKSGENIWLSASIILIHDSQKKPHYFIMYARNLTHQKLAEDHLSYLKQHDAMLDIPNRLNFESFVSQLLKSQNHQKKFCLFLLDVDNFKNVNTTIGYEAGNMILQIIVKRIKELIRGTDLFARLTSDEFAIVITDKVYDETMRAYAERILLELAKPIYIKRHQLYLTASIGISVYPNDGFTTRKLMKHADIALHHVKCHDKNNYQFYSVEMARREKQEFRVKNILAHALAEEKFQVHYQPRFRTYNHTISCVEASLYVTNADGKQLALQDMLDYSEETGLTMPITDWMLNRACRQITEWHDSIRSDIPLVISCEAKYIKHQQWVDKLLKVLQSNQLSAQSLSIEIKKLSEVMQHAKDNDLILSSLSRMRQAGICLILAEDGINFLLSGQVKQYFFDKIKLNQDLISQITLSESTAALVQSIIAVAKEQGLPCIAAGVENESQASLLVKAGCAEMQGMYIAADMPAERCTEYLTTYQAHVTPPETTT